MNSTMKLGSGLRTVSSSRSQRAVVSTIQRAQPIRSAVVKAASSDEAQSVADRRSLLLGSGALMASLIAQGHTSVVQADVEYTKFIGYATPPTSYGGYGGNAIEAPKYEFEYPDSWKQEQPSKVEKGTQGVDGRVVNPRVKGQRAFVITLGRAGEDNKSFRLNDLDQTFAGFAGADYDLQDALTSANEIIKKEKEVDGYQFYEFDIDSPETRYLASITVKSGKVFALFVKSPTKNFKSSEGKLRHIIDTFRLL